MAASFWKKVFSILIPLMLVPGGFTPTKAQAMEPPRPCYAFLGGNVHKAIGLYISCEGKEELITKAQGVWDFAVAADGSALALRRERGKQKGFDVNHRPIDVPHFEIEVVSLKPGFERHWSPVEGHASLYPYCGAILAVARHMYPGSGGPLNLKVTYSTYNVLTGQPVSFPPYVTFGCSADGKTVVGNLDSYGRALWAGLPPRQRIAQAGQYGIITYGISPNGQYVAWQVMEGIRLCVDKNGESLGCVPCSSSTEKISVSDWGGVLYNGGTGETCGGWECTGIFYWRPETRGPIYYKLMGRRPNG